MLTKRKIVNLKYLISLQNILFAQWNSSTSENIGHNFGPSTIKLRWPGGFGPLESDSLNLLQIKNQTP